MNFDSYSANQCDGCRRGLPIRYSSLGNTEMHHDAEGLAVMVCTRDLYESDELIEEIHDRRSGKD